MKKYTKVLVLVLVISILMSMNAFAAGTIKAVAKVDPEDTKVNIIEKDTTQFGITYSGKNGDMYLLMVLDDAKLAENNGVPTASSILYVNQATVAGGTADFNTVYPKDITQSKVYLAGGDLGELTPIATITPDGPVVNLEIVDSSSSIKCDISGDNKSMTVTNTIGACVIAYTTDGGQTYTRLTAVANGAGGYDFSITSVPVGATIVAALKGDITGDGELSGREVTQIKANQLGKLNTLNAFQNFVADLNGDGELAGREVTQIKAAQLGKIDLVW